MKFFFLLIFLLHISLYPSPPDCTKPVVYRFYSNSDILFYTQYRFPAGCDSIHSIPSDTKGFPKYPDASFRETYGSGFFSGKELNRIPDSAGYFIDYCVTEITKNFQAEGNGSLDIYTTLDLDFQKYMEGQAESRFQNQKKENFSNVEVSAIALDVKTGGIRAMIGGKKYSETNKYNRALFSRRQISSTFKPFLYAYAIESSGFLPDALFEDKPIIMNDREGLPWKPKNYYPYYLGTVTLKKAIVVSINTVALQLLQLSGIPEIAGVSRKIFAMKDNMIEERITDNPSLALGSIDLSPLELAGGYLVLANNGLKFPPSGIRRIEDRNGEIFKDLYQSSVKRKERIFTGNTIAVLTDMLKTVITDGTAKEFYQRNLDFEIAGKSGSSPADSWFAGYTPGTVVVAWAGYDFPAESKKRKLPLFIVIPFWMDLISYFRPTEKKFTIPEELEEREFCWDTGKKPDDECTVISGLFPKRKK